MSVFQDEVNSLIHERRSVKPEKYNAIRVPDAVVEQMLENARWAPTHALTEPWHFTVFTQEGLKKFADFQAQLYRSETPEAEFKQAKYDKLISTPLKASHIILIGMVRQLTEKIPEAEEICAVACAMQNMQLTATAYGAGCYWSTGGMTYHPGMKKFLGLGEKDRCLGMLYIGNYNDALMPTPRTPIEQKTNWVK